MKYEVNSINGRAKNKIAIGLTAIPVDPITDEMSVMTSSEMAEFFMSFAFIDGRSTG